MSGSARAEIERFQAVASEASISGHEIAGAPHVGDEMQAHALSPVPPEPSPDPIAALVREGRHREALAACAGTHGALLGRLCMALLGSQADADEAVQETLLRAHRGMAQYRGDGSIKAWLCGIARHVCAHALETRRRGRQLLEVVAPHDEAGPDELARRQEARAVREGLARLKPSEREALVLRFVGGLGHRELAAICNIDEAAARKRISRALARLRTVLPPELLA